MGQPIPSPEIRELAKRLVAHESARPHPSNGEAQTVSGLPDRLSLPNLSVAEKLRRPLSTLAGVSGFRALVSRALTLAKAQRPELSIVQVKPDGSLDIISATPGRPPNGTGDRTSGDRTASDSEAVEVLVTELLWLLVALIGEPFVVILLRDEWPDFAVPETESRSESVQ